MRMSRLRTLAPFGVFAALTVLSTGCGDSNDPDQGISADQAAAIGATAADEAEASASAFTVQTSVAPIGTGAPCVTGSPNTDSDGDGVPDNSTYTFSAPPCEFDVRGGTLKIIGTLVVTDPTPAGAGFAYTAQLQNLRFEFEGDNDASVTRNGSRSATGTAAGLTLDADLVVIRQFDAPGDATVERDWILTFTPAPGGQIQINQPLPSGEIAITGSFDWARGTESFTLTASTAEPLQYDATCTDTSQRIREGELRLAGDFNGQMGYVQVQWNGCDESPSFDFVEN